MSSTSTPRTKSKPHHYVNNEALYNALVTHRKEVAKAKAKGKPAPPVPEYVGECIMRIAERLSTKTNFASYSFREDMVSDAIENILTYLHLFDPEKGRNPFAYMTQVAYFAFIRRIEREKKYSYTKLKVALHQSQQHLDYVTQDGQTVSISDPAWTNYDNVQEFIRAYEAKASRTRQTATKEDTVPEGVVSFDLLDSDDESEDSFDDEETQSLDDPLEL